MDVHVRPRTMARLLDHTNLYRAALIGALLLAPALLHAQGSDEIYGGEEVESTPRVAAPAQLARVVVSAVPPGLKGMPGKVALEFVVGKDGKVEPESVRVLEASNKSLGEAIAKAAPRMAFVPGQKGGQPVRVRVRVPFDIAG